DTRDLHFRNVHVNAESGFGTCDENGCATYLRASKFPYENAIQDVTRGLEVREREFAALDLTSAAVAAATPGAFADAKVEKLASGFYAAAGAAIAPDGTLYFVDHHQQRIYAWSRAEGLRVVNYAPLDPV
ncbi:gluconolaconase, partial [Pseudomonas sp. FW305-130]